MITKQFADVLFIAVEITERAGVLQGELQWLKRAFEADQVDGAGKIARGTQDSEGVGRRAEADIPDHEFANMIGESFAQLELVDVKRFGFGNGSDDRMKRFAVRERMNAVRATGELDEFIAARGAVWFHE